MTEDPKYANLVAQAEKAVANVADPELKRIAFQKILDDLRASISASMVDPISKSVQVLAVVVGVIVSVISITNTLGTEAATRKKEAEARLSEAERYKEQQKIEAAKRQAEAAKPFLELRQKLYLEAVAAAGVLANQKLHTCCEIDEAKKRFRELYVAELSMVEDFDVEKQMKSLAGNVDPELTELTDEQKAAYHLAHALRDSLAKAWGRNQDLVDKPNP